MFSKNIFAKSPIEESLIYHAYFGDAESISKLIEKGGDPNTTDEHGWPILAVAADRGDNQALEISRILIKSGADINAAYNNNYPLFNAIKNNNAALVALLVSEDANLRIKNPDQESVYKVAKKLGNEDIIYYIEKQIFEEQQTKEYLESKLHASQLTAQYSFHHCAFNYWGFYLRSKQDKKVNEEDIKQRMRNNATAASQIAQTAIRYFPRIYKEKFEDISKIEREHISQTLNAMISNRNRRILGVGKIDDLLKRCHAERVPKFFWHKISK